MSVFDFTITPDAMDRFSAELEAQLEALRQPVQGAMGEAFFEIVRHNFGRVGVDRPIDWVPLSAAYAKKVGRDFATLSVSGALAGAVKFSNDDADHARVSVSDSDVPYATVHQTGGGNNIPARPYFPVDSTGQLTDFTRNEVINAAAAELERRLA